jgi:chaperonin GroES
MKIQPLQDRVIVQRVEEDNKTAGGIIIPDSAKEKPQQGKIMAVGPGKVLEGGTRVEMTVKKGDLVLFGKYSGSEVTLDGDELLIMREDDILGVIKKK